MVVPKIDRLLPSAIPTPRMKKTTRQQTSPYLHHLFKANLMESSNTTESEVWSFSTDGTQEQLLEKGLFQSISPSPNGNILGFGCKNLGQHWFPLDFPNEPRRGIHWYRDHTVAQLPWQTTSTLLSTCENRGVPSLALDDGATLWWVEALDDGDARKDPPKDARTHCAFFQRSNPAVLLELRFYTLSGNEKEAWFTPIGMIPEPSEVNQSPKSLLRTKIIRKVIRMPIRIQPVLQKKQEWNHVIRYSARTENRCIDPDEERVLTAFFHF